LNRKREQDAWVRFLINIALILILLQHYSGRIVINPQTDISSDISTWITIILINWILPTYSTPSIYDTSIYSTRLHSRYSRFLARLLYGRSFTQIFIFRIATSFLLTPLFDYNNFIYRGFSSVRLLGEVMLLNLGQFITGMITIKIIHKGLWGGFLRYYPSAAELQKLRDTIQRLKAEAKSNNCKLERSRKLDKLDIGIAEKQRGKRSSFGSCLRQLASASGFSSCTSFCKCCRNCCNSSNPGFEAHSTSIEYQGKNIEVVICHNDYDQKFTKRRFDVSFELRAADAAIRGFAVARQFPFPLPEMLGFVKGLTDFS